MFLLSATSLSIKRGCDAHQRFEMFCKVTLIGEANGKRDLGRAQRRMEQLPRSRDTQLSEIVMRRKTNHVAEDSQEMKRADIHEAGKLFKRNIFRIVIFQVGAYLLHPYVLPS